MAKDKEKSQIAPTGIDNPDLSNRELTESLGADGTRNFSGYIFQDHNPDFADNRAASVIFDKMRKNDAQVNATLQAMYLPIRTTKWFLRPATDENGETDDFAKEVNEFVHYNLFECIDFDFLLSQILLMLPFGYSVFEKVYDVDQDGKIIISKLAYRRPETILSWETMEGGAGVTQILDAPIKTGVNKDKNQVSIPAEKLLIFTHNREGNDYQGTSILRSAYKHWNYKNTFYRFDSIKQERESLGLPVVYLPQNTDAETQDKLQEIVKNIRISKQIGIVIPGTKSEGWELELITPKSSDNTKLWESIKHHNKEISKNILAMFLDAGSDGVGSYALSENQSNVFMYSLESVAKCVKGVLQKYLIKEIVDLNYETDGYYPTLEYDRIGEIDTEKTSDALMKLANAGLITPDFETEGYIREIMGLPPKSKDEEQEEPDETKEEKPKEEVEEAVNDEKEMSDDAEWRDFAKLFTNRTIIDLQNELSPEEMEELKKKGLRFNDYEGKAFRPLTFAERKVNFSLIKKTMEKYEKDLDKALKEIEKKQKEDLVNQIKRAVENDDAKALGTIKLKYNNQVGQVVNDIQKEAFEAGKKTAATEMGVKVPPTKREIQGAMRVQTDAVVAKAASDAETAAKNAVAYNANKAGGITNLQSGTAGVIATQAIDNALTKARNAYHTYAIGGAINTGRTSVFERYPEKVYAMQYSAILDNRTTDLCMSLDGRVFKAGSAAASQYTPPQHMNCRSILVEILEEEEFKPRIDTGEPYKSIPPTKDLSGRQELKKPVVKKNSPAIKQIQQEIAKRERLVDKYKSADKYPNRVKSHEKRIRSLKSAIRGKFTDFVRSLI